MAIGLVFATLLAVYYGVYRPCVQKKRRRQGPIRDAVEQYSLNSISTCLYIVFFSLPWGLGNFSIPIALHCIFKITLHDHYAFQAHAFKSCFRRAFDVLWLVLPPVYGMGFSAYTMVSFASLPSPISIRKGPCSYQTQNYRALCESYMLFCHDNSPVNVWCYLREKRVLQHITLTVLHVPNDRKLAL